MDNAGSLQQFHKELQVKAMEQGIPVFGGFELTPRCNLRCKMCYVASNSNTHKELTTQEWIKLGQKAAETGALAVFITGGEPLIRDDFKEIYNVYCRLGFRITLFTNGTLIDEDFAKWLSQIPPSTVDVTLYGASEDTYGALCGTREAYGRAIDAIEMLLKHNINTRIKSTLVKTNWPDYQQLKKIADSYGLEFISSRLIHGNRTNGITACERERLEPSQYYAFETDNIDEFKCEVVDIDSMIRHYQGIPPMACVAGRCSFFIQWNGHMTPCPLFTETYSEPLKTGYSEAWHEIQHKVDDIPGAAKCRSCDLRAFCAACPPRLFLETGSYEKSADYLCALADKKKAFVEYVNEVASHRMP